MSKELKEGFIYAHEQLAKLQSVLIEGDFEASKVVYDAATSLYTAAGEFIQYLEEAEVRSDENLDIEKTKLPNLDELFINNPATEYVNAAILLAQSPNSPEARKSFTEATFKLAAHQGTLDGAVERPETLSEFIDRVFADINFVDERYAEMFRENLVAAIKTLESRPGYSEFFVTTAEGMKSGKLKVSSTAIDISLDGKDYHFDVPTELPEEDEAAEEECTYPDCSCGEVEYTTSEQLIDYIDTLESDYASLVSENLELVENELSGKTEFSQADLYLIRYYLKHLPDNSSYEVDSLSDRGLELAWKKHKYLKNL